MYNGGIFDALLFRFAPLDCFGSVFNVFLTCCSTFFITKVGTYTKLLLAGFDLVSLFGISDAFSILSVKKKETDTSI